MAPLHRLNELRADDRRRYVRLAAHATMLRTVYVRTCGADLKAHNILAATQAIDVARRWRVANFATR